MKKILFYIFILVGFFFTSMELCNAKIINSFDKFDDKVIIEYGSSSDSFSSCDGLFTKDALDLFSEILNIFRILGPVALILFIAIEYTKAIVSQDNDFLKKANQKVIKRCIACACLFFIPTAIRAALNLDGVREAIQIPDDPLCGTLNTVINLDDLDIK